MTAEPRPVSNRSLAQWKQTLQRLWNGLVHQRWINLGLRGKMAFMVEVGVIGLTLIFLMIGVNTARQTTLRILNERMMVARLSAAALDSTLLHVRSILEITMANPVVSQPTAPVAEKQDALATAFSQIALAADGVYLVDGRGRVVAAVGNQNPQFEWQAVHTGEVDLQPDVHVISRSETKVLVVAPLTGKAGSQGFLAAVLDFDASDLAPFQGSIDLGGTGAVDLVNADGVIIAT